MAAAPEFAFNLFDPEIKADPYPHYAEMRACGRVISNPFLGGQFMVSGFEDVVAMLNDPAIFTNGGIGAGGSAGVFSAPTMLTSDPPDHERLRGVVARAFTPRSVTALEPRMHELAADLAAPLADGEPFDVVTQLAEPLPVLVIAEMLGVATADIESFAAWSHGLMGVLDPFAPTDKIELAQQCSKHLHDYFAEEVVTRRRRPTADDLVGRLVAANTEGRLTEAEMLASCVLLLLGGNETTTKLVTNAMLALARHPDERARVVTERGLLPTSVEEALRFDTPVQGNARVVSRATEIAGIDIPTGSLVVGLLGAANRDPGRFPDPDRFDVGRTPNPHLSFGRGIHHCLGAALARMEGTAAIGAALAAAPEFELAQPTVALEYGPTFFFHSPVELQIVR